MNVKRILLGGLLAGVIVNASEFLMNGVVLAKQMAADMAQHSLVMASWAMVGFVLMAFVYGFALAWLYAAFRPRFGPGFGTALIAAATVWTLSYLLPTVMMSALGMGSSSTLIALVWGAAELVIAGAVAGALYREVEAAPSVAPTA